MKNRLQPLHFVVIIATVIFGQNHQKTFPATSAKNLPQDFFSYPLFSFFLSKSLSVPSVRSAVNKTPATITAARIIPAVSLLLFLCTLM